MYKIEKSSYFCYFGCNLGKANKVEIFRHLANCHEEHDLEKWGLCIVTIKMSLDAYDKRLDIDQSKRLEESVAVDYPSSDLQRQRSVKTSSIKVQTDPIMG